MSQSFGRVAVPLWRHPATIVLAVVVIVVVASVLGPEEPAPQLRIQEGAAPAWRDGDGAEPKVPEEHSEKRNSWARDRVDEARRAGDPLRLARLLSRLVLDEKGVGASDFSAWCDELDALGERSFFDANAKSPAFGTTEVLGGDSYWKIATRLRKAGHRVNSGLLQAVNGISPAALREGEALRFPKGEVTLRVDKERFRLFLLHDERIVKTYRVGIGAEDRTPEGVFTVGGKVKEPAWTDPVTRKRYRYGEKGHRIGSRWMRFYDGKRGTSFGIHGTDEPESIGKAASLGCIRMLKDDVEELYELVPDGCSVTIGD